MKAGAALCVLGWILAGLALSMLIPAFTALLGGDPKNAKTFLNAAAISGFFAGALITGLRGKEAELNLRGALLLIFLVWTVLPFFAAAPIYYSGVSFSASKALFEAVSGLTTTGATVLTHLERKPEAILIWRALLQWHGGFFTIIAASSIFTALEIGGGQLQYASMPHGAGETLFGRIRQAVRPLLLIYSLLTLLCFLGLWAVGMPRFDAFCHALSAISTGGFSTRDGSIGAFNSPMAEMVLALFMLLGAMNMVLHWAAINGRWRGYSLDPEMRYLGIACLVAAMSVFIALLVTDYPEGRGAVRWAVFNSISFLTTSGFWTGNISGAPEIIGVFLCLAVLVGGATGSSSGGFKLMRVGLVVKQGWLELARLTDPRAILRLRYGGVRVSPSQIAGVWVVFTAFVFTLVLGVALISLTGPSFEQSVAIAAASIANAGPVAGFFSTDSVTPYARLPEEARALAMIGMIMGRMEVLTVLTLLSPAFWRS